MSVGNNIPQTMSAKSEVKKDTFPQTSFKGFKSALDFQACAYYPKLTEGEISQQSADQLLWFYIKPVEFDGFRMQAEMWNPESELEEEE